MTKRAKPVYVLGTGLSHDGSACLLKDGRICVAIEKERITRVKHDGFNDSDAITYCLRAEGIGIADVDLVVQNANYGMFERGNDWFNGPRVITDEVPTVAISHHLAHAYGAFGTSPFDESAILIIDGCGSGYDDCIDLQNCAVPEKPSDSLQHLFYEKDSYYIFADNKLRPVYKDFSPFGTSGKRYPLHPPNTMHSIGGLYSAASVYVFSGFDDSGKLMGLAPYGRPGVHDFEVFRCEGGRVFVNYDWMGRFRLPQPKLGQLKENFQHYADLAYWIQREVERAVVYIINSRYEMAPSDNLCYAGGVALNAVANRLIRERSPFKDVYIQPAAGDNGVAVGCAYYGWLEVLKNERVKHDGATCFGINYGEQDISDLLDRYEESVEIVYTEDYIMETAKQLANGKTVGWFSGRSEFGPRALGHRSILADPRIAEMRDFINTRIKLREDFRPFAPSVLLEDVSVYFECDYESRYMLLVAPVREEWRDQLPSITHLDNSARIQTVSKSSHPIYYELLRKFKEITGVGVLLNTSFNRKWMPIVETPQEGLDFFLKCDLDILVLNNRVIRKRSGVGVSRNFSVAKLFNEDLNVLLRRNADQARTVGGIYQFNINAVQTWTLDLSGSGPIIIEGTISSPPNTIIEASDQTIRDILLDPNHRADKQLQSGDIKITGEFEHAVNLLGLFKVISAPGISLINSAAIQETADGDQTAEINSRMAQ